MTVAVQSAFAILSLTGVLLLVRLVIGPAIADRVVALDTLLLVVIAGIAVAAAATADGTLIDVLLLVSLLGFVSTVTASRFVERRSDVEEEPTDA